MKKIMSRVVSCTGALILMATPSVLRATPYASAVTNNNGTVQFILNESATSVSVLFDNRTVTNVLGALSAGQNSFSLGTHTNFAIVVIKNGAGSFNQISVDTTNNSFFGPRGVAVNNNPKTFYFGRVYAVNASAGTGVTPAQHVDRGVYILNADTSDALGRFSTGSTAGLTFSSSTTTYSPYKIFVGPDDKVYMGDASNPTVYSNYATNAVTMFDPNVTVQTPILGWGTASGTFGGVISTPVVTGSLAAGNLQLYTFQWGFAAQNGVYNSMYGYNVGGTAPSTVTPSILADPTALDGIDTVDTLVMDLAMATNGYFFALVDRTAAVGQDCLFVYANDALTLLWDSLTASGGTPGTPGSGIDPLSGCFGVSVSPDGKYAACVRGSDGAVLLMNMTNGIPDISTLSTNVTGAGGTTRSLAFDLADNIYVISGGNDRLRQYSLGLTTTATTYNDKTGTNGTFSLVVPPTTVSVVAITNQASQSGPTPGVFQISRAGQNLNQPLTVNFAFSGTATSGVYTVAQAGIIPAGTNNSVVIAPNQVSTNIVIIPVVDGVSRPTTTVTFSLLGGTNYSAVFPNQDTVYIQNTGPQLVFVSSVAIPTMYNAFSNDFAGFTVTRWGNTNVSSYSVNFTSAGGTAIVGVDYTTPGSITFNPGDSVYTNYIYPLSNGQLPVNSSTNPYVGNKTAIVVVASSGGYTAGTNSAAMTILDSAYPPATVLFSDPLTDPNDATNWGVTSANNNMLNVPIDDTINFGYDLQNGNPGEYGAIPLPPSGAATALRVTCNKNTGAAAGVDLYPTNVSFSGNYAVRFSMNVVQGYNTSFTTEGPLFGINHTGISTNWWSGSGISSGWDPAGTNENWQSDGIWYWIDADTGNGGGEYLEKTGLGPLPNTGWNQLNALFVTPFVNAFKTNIYTGGLVDTTGGLVSNGSILNGNTANNWADVEIRQMNNIVTMSVNKTVIFVYTNTTTFTSGKLMLGYDDPFSSVGGIDAAVYYSNLRVVSLGNAPFISQIAINPVNHTAVINFTSTDAEATAASFSVVSAPSLQGSFSTAAGATITQLSPGAFQAVVPQSGSIQFYRVVEN